jgi:serine/threonine protein kinase
MYYDEDLVAFNSNIYGHYIKQKTIYDGNYSDIILAKNLNGEYYVLKVLTKEYTKLAINEINILKSLQDISGVVKYIEHFETSFEIIIVLEYCKGCDLFDYLEKPVEHLTAKCIFENICSIMNKVHEKGYCHRDLKPENIIINPLDLSITVIDWAYGSKINNIEYNRCGSPNYVAPEVLKSELYKGPEIDVWSMGAIYYSLLTNKFAFPGYMDTRKQRDELFNNIKNIKVDYDVNGLKKEDIELLKKIFVEKNSRINLSEILNTFF